MSITLSSVAAELTANRGYPRNKIADAVSVLVTDVRVGACSSLSDEQAEEMHAEFQSFNRHLGEWDAYKVNAPTLACNLLKRIAAIFDSYGSAQCPNESRRIRAAEDFLASCGSTL